MDHLPAFRIRDKILPGLAKLGEECGELNQVFGKLVMTGGRREHWEGSDLYHRLEEEMGDVFAALDFLLEHSGELNLRRVYARRASKRALFEKWRQENQKYPGEE